MKKTLRLNRLLILALSLALLAASALPAGCRSAAAETPPVTLPGGAPLQSTPTEPTNETTMAVPAAATTTPAAATTTTTPTTASTTPLTTATDPLLSLPAAEAPSSEHPVIALTFDDGPSLRDTGKLLDILKAEQVPATFFVLGNQIDAGRQSLVERAFNEGHEIGNHTYAHLTLRKAGADKVRSELTKTSDLIARITGRPPTVMRPPTGAYDDTTIAVSKELGMALVNWSYQSCPEDWNHRGEPQYIADYVVSKAANGHIVLLHDTNSSTVEAVPDMIKGLKARGFRFMTVSQLLAFQGAGEPAPGKVYFQYSVKKASS